MQSRETSEHATHCARKVEPTADYVRWTRRSRGFSRSFSEVRRGLLTTPSAEPQVSRRELRLETFHWRLAATSSRAPTGSGPERHFQTRTSRCRRATTSSWAPTASERGPTLSCDGTLKPLDGSMSPSATKSVRSFSEIRPERRELVASCECVVEHEQRVLYNAPRFASYRRGIPTPLRSAGLGSAMDGCAPRRGSAASPAGLAAPLRPSP